MSIYHTYYYFFFFLNFFKQFARCLCSVPTLGAEHSPTEFLASRVQGVSKESLMWEMKSKAFQGTLDILILTERPESWVQGGGYNFVSLLKADSLPETCNIFKMMKEEQALQKGTEPCEPPETVHSTTGTWQEESPGPSKEELELIFPLVR